jgi:hypothetical protein
LYLDVLSQSQPLAILPWELTPDYGLIAFDGATPQPSKRFWFLKQLSATTGAGALHLDITSDNPTVHAAAFFNTGDNGYSIHILNTGASRQISIAGIPPGVHKFQVYLTDSIDDYHKADVLTVDGGVTRMQLPAMCFVTLTSGQPPDDPLR